MSESIAGADNPWASISQIGRGPLKQTYSIYDTPDDEESSKKLKAMFIRGFGVGSYVAVCEMIAFSKPTTAPTMLARYSTVCFPVVAMAATYPAIVCVSANIRKKDGPLNHFIGGFVSGTILGTRLKNQKVAWGAGIGLGLLGAFLKLAAFEKLVFLPDVPYKSLGSFGHYNHSHIPGAPRRQLEMSDSLPSQQSI